MYYNPFSLAGKTILITGAASGIGKAAAIECSKLGAIIILTDINEENLKITISLLEGHGHQMFVADLTQDDEIRKLSEFTPVLDGCINNAGVNIIQLVPFIKKETLQKILDINTIAPIMLTHYLVKNKKMKKNSSFVFTSSLSGQTFCSPGNGLYSATKGAITAFMKNAAIDLAPKGIRCNAVMPGMIETPLKDDKTALTEEQWNKNRERYPLKRFGQPNDVAHAMIYFLSDAASWVTGSTLIIDGGLSLQ